MKQMDQGRWSDSSQRLFGVQSTSHRGHISSSLSCKPTLYYKPNCWLARGRDLSFTLSLTHIDFHVRLVELKASSYR